MNNDLSLSRALGGLRIANPDDSEFSLDHEDPTCSQPIPLASASSPDLLRVPTDSSTTASVVPVDMQRQRSADSQNGSLPCSMPSSRPASGLYASTVHRDPASNSYNSRPEPSRTSVYGTPTRSDSRSNIERHGGIPSRESSQRRRTYNQNQHISVSPSAAPLPPRRSSKGMGGGYASIPGVAVVPEPRSLGPELPPPGSSEEWKERGAAISVRREIDANGKTVMKPVKKGVKDFSFGRILGEGSYSTVYFATDRQTLKEYAIKVLEKKHIIKEKKIKYVNIEKDTLNRLTEHPGIVRLYYTFQDEQSLYYVLDLCNGGELLGVLKKTGTFNEECARFFGAQVLDAVEYMHSRGVIHRDLKPENVLLDDQLHVKITDFGTARLLSDPRAPQAAMVDDASGRGKDRDDSRAASFVGTAEYVSPELLTNKNACKASDLWAFGCIIYQLLAGRPPFKAGSEYLTFQKIVNLDYDFPAGFPPAARDLVERCLVLDPARRLTIEHIKNHEFFDGQQFGKVLWRTKAPRLRPHVPTSQEAKIIQLNGANTPPPIATSRVPQPGNGMNGSSRAPGRIITDIPPPSQLDIEWSPVLTRTNERILRLGDLMVLSTPIPNSPHGKGSSEHGQGPGKLARFFGGSTTKKRQRLVMVTSSGRIVLAPSGGEEKKSKLEISLLGPDCSWKSQMDARGQTVWCVDSHGVHYTFEEPKAPSSLEPPPPTADDWLESLEQAKGLAMSLSVTGSYGNENGFGDMSSSMSSPTSTLGGNGGYSEGFPEGFGIRDRSHRNHLSKSQASPDESSTKRNRFSKRQSRQGLGPAF